MAQETLGELIRKRRRELKLTQADLAKQIGVRSTYISRIETGERPGRYEKLAKISMALALPWAEMMKTGEIEMPLMDGESPYPYLDLKFTRFHPRVKEQLTEIGEILEKYV